VPRLQATHSPLVSAAILGVLVALWHLPLIGDTGWIGIATTFVITFVYVWLFNRTDGSVLLVLLFHNAQGFATMPDLGYTGDAVTRQQMLEFAAWTVIALVLIVADRGAWRTAADDRTSHDRVGDRDPGLR
jgi:membrane protease YdiL (CAAX protease family)